MRKVLLISIASVTVLGGVLFARHAGAGDLNDQICSKDIPDPPDKAAAGEARRVFVSNAMCTRTINDKYLGRGWRVVALESTPGGIGWMVAVEKR